MEREYDALPTYWARIEKLVRERVMQSTREWLDRYQKTEARHQFELGAHLFGAVLQSAISRTRREPGRNIDDSVLEAVRKLLA